MSKAWIIHCGILLLLAVVGIPLTVADLSSYGLLRGVGTFYYWAGYLILVVSTTAFFILAHLVFKHKRPLASLGIAYAIPALVLVVLQIKSEIFVFRSEMVREALRGDILKHGITLDSWMLSPLEDTGGCELVLQMQAGLSTVVSFRPLYREWYGEQSHHKVEAGQAFVIRRALAFKRTDRRWNREMHPAVGCDAYDARDFVFTLQCGTDAGVAFVYRTDVQAEPGTGQYNHSKVVRPLTAVRLPEPLNQTVPPQK